MPDKNDSLPTRWLEKCMTSYQKLWRSDDNGKKNTEVYVKGADIII